MSMQISAIVMDAADSGVLLKAPRTLDVPSGCTIEEALVFLGVKTDAIEGLIRSKCIAIFGETCKPGQRLHEGDRLEFLDELHFDPMESRRRRASHTQKKRGTTHTGRSL